MAKLTPKELGRKAAEREFAIGPQTGFWEWQNRLPAEEWADALQAYQRRRATLEEQGKTPVEPEPDVNPYAYFDEAPPLS